MDYQPEEYYSPGPVAEDPIFHRLFKSRKTLFLAGRVLGEVTFAPSFHQRAKIPVLKINRLFLLNVD
jgi:hypothetical protein